MLNAYVECGICIYEANKVCHTSFLKPVYILCFKQPLNLSLCVSYYFIEGIDEMIPVSCFNINYGGVYGPTEMDKAETTWAILSKTNNHNRIIYFFTFML